MVVSLALLRHRSARLGGKRWNTEGGKSYPSNSQRTKFNAGNAHYQGAHRAGFAGRVLFGPKKGGRVDHLKPPPHYK